MAPEDALAFARGFLIGLPLAVLTWVIGLAIVWLSGGFDP